MIKKCITRKRQPRKYNYIMKAQPNMYVSTLLLKKYRCLVVPSSHVKLIIKMATHKFTSNEVLSIS